MKAKESAMRSMLHAVVGLCLAIALAGAASAQRGAEQFIPIGESPGVSGVSSVMGVVSSVDQRRGVMIVEVAGEPVSFVMTPNTEVWLDRSGERRSNLAVGYAGLRIGDIVEVKRGDPEVVAATAGASQARIADWIKIEATARE